MQFLIEIFGAAVLAAAGLAMVAAYSPERLRVKLLALALAALSMALFYVALIDLLSRPKPAEMEWAKAEAATVLVEVLVEGRAIYLWLRAPDQVEPRAYVYPWDLEMAKALVEARRASTARGAPLRMARPFEPSQETRQPMFHAAPPPALPPKRIR